MAIVTQCTAPGCETLTIGPLCIEHDQQPARVFVRGRPLLRDVAAMRRPVPAAISYAPSFRKASERRAAVPGRR